MRTAAPGANELPDATQSLAELDVGGRARVLRLDGPPFFRQRLREMGLTAGTVVQVIRTAPLGDPIELHLRGYRLSVRKSEAAAVVIEAG